MLILPIIFVLILLFHEIQTWDPLFLHIELHDLEDAFHCVVGRVKTSLGRYFPRNIMALSKGAPSVLCILR